MMGGSEWGSCFTWGGGHMFGGIFMVVIVIVLFLLVGALMKGACGHHKSDRAVTPGPEDPIEILKRRYAQGEIDKEEFEEKKKGLTG